MLNLRKIYVAHVSKLPNSEQALRKIADSRNQSFEELLDECIATWGSNPSTDPLYQGSTVEQEGDPGVGSKSVGLYIGSAAEKIIFYAIIQSSIGWKRYMEVNISKPRNNRKYTVSGLTVSEQVYQTEMVQYYMEHWKNDLRTNGFPFELTYKALAEQQGMDPKTVSQRVLGITFAFINVNNLKADDMPEILNGRRKTYPVISRDGDSISSVVKLVNQERRIWEQQKPRQLK